MLLRQLFDYESYTYTYLLADSQTGQACLIDPVIEQVPRYLQLLNELQLTLIAALDTHVHADHVTALGTLRQHTHCQTYVGNPGEVTCADHALQDGMQLNIGSLTIQVLFTPGHTDDSYCFYLAQQGLLFTGDTLLIRGTGRTDFQNGNPQQLYHSLHQVLLQLPPETQVYPGHDYKGWTQSTLAEEKQHNPRLQFNTVETFSDHMNNLNLPSPKLMDIAVPANRGCGQSPLS